MTGGRAQAGQWLGTDADDDAAIVEPLTERDDVRAPSADWRTRIAAVVAVLAALGWIALVVMTRQGRPASALTGDALVAMVGDIVPPLILIAVLYLLAVRLGRGESARFARVSNDLRGEQARLEAVLAHVADRLAAERSDIAEQSDRLSTLGEDAATRLAHIGETLRGDIETLVREAERLKAAAGAARGDTSALLVDMPRAHEATVALSDALDGAGQRAHEHAAALDAQVAALTLRGREADEIAGGAAAKLAAHLSRIEGLSGSATERLLAAADSMTGAIDAALARAAQAGEVARQGMDAQAATMRALVEESEAALTRTGADASVAVSRRIADVSARIDALGRGITAVGGEVANLDEAASNRLARLDASIVALRDQASGLGGELGRGDAAASAMIGRAETLMTAYAALGHEIDDALPAALARLDAHADATLRKAETLSPTVHAIEASAAVALDRLLEAEAALANQHAALDALGTAVAERLAAGTAAAGDLVAQVGEADARTRALAEGASALLIDALLRVREAANASADRAREAIAEVIPASADAMKAAAGTALADAIADEARVRIEDLAVTAQRAVAAANAASDRLMRQMLTIAETSAQIETRIVEARGEIEDADRDNFARRVALLIESLNSTAIDVTKILSNDIADSAWSAYLKGDRGVFTRRAVRLLDAGEAREIARHYADDMEFREQVNRYVHDFEAMLRNVLATRAGSPLGVTLLSSDMGKLYVALAQAIERLR